MIVSTESLKRAGEIITQIEGLQVELGSLFAGGNDVAAPKRRGRPPGSQAGTAKAPGKRNMSAEGRARIAAAARARWAKFNAAKAKAAKAK